MGCAPRHDTDQPQPLSVFVQFSRFLGNLKMFFFNSLVNILLLRQYRTPKLIKVFAVCTCSYVDILRLSEPNYKSEENLLLGILTSLTQIRPGLTPIRLYNHRIIMVKDLKFRFFKAGYHSLPTRKKPKVLISGEASFLHMQKAVFLMMRHKIEPPCGKTNNVVSDQVRHKPTCAVTEKS